MSQILKITQFFDPTLSHLKFLDNTDGFDAACVINDRLFIIVRNLKLQRTCSIERIQEAFPGHTYRVDKAFQQRLIAATLDTCRIESLFRFPFEKEARNCALHRAMVVDVSFFKKNQKKRHFYLQYCYTPTGGCRSIDFNGEAHRKQLTISEKIEVGVERTLVDLHADTSVKAHNLLKKMNIQFLSQLAQEFGNLRNANVKGMTEEVLDRKSVV